MLVQASQGQSGSAHVVVLGNEKGGSGKSTTALHVAVALLKAGQRVWLFNGQRNGRAFGTAAEYIALAEHLVTPLPDNLSFAQGATLGIPCMTAWCSLFCDGPIAGQTVLVTGGAGAVGHYAVQLAKWGGARVIATVSSAAKAEQARLAGADGALASAGMRD